MKFFFRKLVLAFFSIIFCLCGLRANISRDHREFPEIFFYVKKQVPEAKYFERLFEVDSFNFDKISSRNRFEPDVFVCRNVYDVVDFIRDRLSMGCSFSLMILVKSEQKPVGIRFFINADQSFRVELTAVDDSTCFCVRRFIISCLKKHGLKKGSALSSLAFGEMTSGEKLEIFFGDYINDTAMYQDKKVASLKSLIGKLAADGNLSGGLSWDEAERRHDWIQWAFPTKTFSRFNQKALCSDDYFQKIMQEKPEYRNALLLSFKYFLNFMGIDLAPDLTADSAEKDIIFLKRPDFAARMQNYLENTHNFLRTTRILESLKIHGLERYSLKFYNFLTTTEKSGLSVWCGERSLKGLYLKISDETKSFWKSSSGVNSSHE